MTDPFEFYEQRIKELERDLRAQRDLAHSVAQLSRSFLFDFVEGYDNEDCVREPKALIVLLDSIIHSHSEAA